MSDVAVIVLTYNSVSKLGEFFKKAVFSLFNQSYKNYRVIFVDNGSRDETLNYLKQAQRETNVPIKILSLRKNYGWSYSNNIGALVAKDADYFFFINDDVILARHVLERLIKFMEENRDVGAAQPIIINKDDSRFYGFDIGLGGLSAPVLKPRGHPFSEAFFASGAALITPARVFFEVGMFPSDYFLYYDDVDYSWRIRLLGYRVGCVTTTWVYHHGSATFGHKSPVFLYYNTRNMLLSLFKNVPRKLLFQTLALSILEASIAYVLHEILIEHNFINTIAALKGLRAGILQGIRNLYCRRCRLSKKRLSKNLVVFNPRVDIDALIPRTLREIVFLRY
ncbi:MAG: glycosyltransferase family 2 protein [Infirmifilum sp.]